MARLYGKNKNIEKQMIMKNTITKILVTIAACAISCVQSFAITKITASNYSDFYIDANSYTQYIGYYAITSSADLKAFANLVNGGTNNIWRCYPNFYY